VRKKLLAGAAVLALLINAPQVSADDDIVIFGEEFETEAAPAPDKKKSEKPAPVKKLPAPEKKPAPPEKIEPVETQTPPEEPVTFPEDNDEWSDTLVFDDLSKLPKPEESSQPKEEPPPKVEQPTQPTPIIEEQPTQPTPIIEKQPTQPTPIIEEQPTQPTPIIEEQPTQPTPIVPPPVIKTPQELDRPFEQPTDFSSTRTEKPTIRSNEKVQSPVMPQKKLKTLKPRFVKLAADDRYTYYLDKNAVQWKKMPYSSSEYIADVWVRMIERKPQELDSDMAAYGADNFNAEISSLAEKGYQYSPGDLEVLQSQSYVLEHYYLRPKTNQIQFLCELEVFGRPQNTINERTYDYKNWESLVPDSVESIIYTTVIKTIGTKKASEKGHMTLVDMIEEYGRFSLR